MSVRPRRLSRGFTLVEVMVTSLLLTLVLGGVFSTFRAGRRSTRFVEARADMAQTGRVVIDKITTDLASLYVEPPELEQAEEPGAEAGGTPEEGDVGAGGPDIGGMGAGGVGAGMDDSAEMEDLGAFEADQSDGEEEEKLPPLIGMGDELGRDEADDIEFTAAIGPRRRGLLPPTLLSRVRYYLDIDDATPEEGLMRVENRYLDLTDSEAAQHVEEVSALVQSLNFRYYDPEEEEWFETWEEETPPTAVEVTLVVADPRDELEPLFMYSVVNLRVVGVKAIGESFAPAQGGAAGGEGAPAEGEGGPESGFPEGGMGGEFGGAPPPDGMFTAPGRTSGPPDGMFTAPGRTSGPPDSMFTSPGRTSGPPDSMFTSPGRTSGPPDSMFEGGR